MRTDGSHRSLCFTPEVLRGPFCGRAVDAAVPRERVSVRRRRGFAGDRAPLPSQLEEEVWFCSGCDVEPIESVHMDAVFLLPRCWLFSSSCGVLMLQMTVVSFSGKISVFLCKPGEEPDSL